jgi:hypothetical protein
MHPKKTLGEAGPLTRFVAKEAFCELGNWRLSWVYVAIRLGTKRALSPCLTNGSEQGYSRLVEPAAADQIANLAKRFRNPAAHAETFTRDQVSEARRLTFKCLKMMCPSTNHTPEKLGNGSLGSAFAELELQIRNGLRLFLELNGRTFLNKIQMIPRITKAIDRGLGSRDEATPQGIDGCLKGRMLSELNLAAAGCRIG